MKSFMELFDCSKGTVRETLKSLEVQALLVLKRGQLLVPVLIEVPIP